MGTIARTLLSARPWRITRPRRPVIGADASAVEPVPDWTWTVDAAGSFTATSDSSLDAIGYRPAELIGRSVDLVMDPAELARASAIVTGLTGSTDDLAHVIIAGRHRSGATSWFDVTVRPLFDVSGAVVACYGISRPIHPQDRQVLGAQRIRTRIQGTIAGRLLMSAYQPIVDARTGQPIGVEALTRFVEEPSNSTEQWFADATAVGLGTDLELLAVETALTSATSVPAELYVSVNVSPLTCVDPRLGELLLHSHLDPRRIVLELTEHSQVIDYPPLNAVLDRLRESGIRIAVDDAGAGYSSGLHIVRIRPEVIKLDRSIVASIDIEPAQRALAGGIVQLAGHIGAQVTAEGIRTPAEWRCVVELGIHAGQGYLFGRPSVRPSEWAGWGGGQPIGAGAVGAGGMSTVPADPCPPVGNPLDHLPAVLDALPDPTAVLDADGVIVCANRAWLAFRSDICGVQVADAVGSNYLADCTTAAASAGPTETGAGIEILRRLLRGGPAVSEREFFCRTPSGSRWYVSRATAIGAPTGGAVISYLERVVRQDADREIGSPPIRSGGR